MKVEGSLQLQVASCKCETIRCVYVGGVVHRIAALIVVVVGHMANLAAHRISVGHNGKVGFCAGFATLNRKIRQILHILHFHSEIFIFYIHTIAVVKVRWEERV